MNRFLFTFLLVTGFSQAASTQENSGANTSILKAIESLAGVEFPTFYGAPWPDSKAIFIRNYDRVPDDQDPSDAHQPLYYVETLIPAKRGPFLGFYLVDAANGVSFVRLDLFDPSLKSHTFRVIVKRPGHRDLFVDYNHRPAIDADSGTAGQPFGRPNILLAFYKRPAKDVDHTLVGPLHATEDKFMEFVQRYHAVNAVDVSGAELDAFLSEILVAVLNQRLDQLDRLVKEAGPVLSEHPSGSAERRDRVAVADIRLAKAFESLTGLFEDPALIDIRETPLSDAWNKQETRLVEIEKKRDEYSGRK